PCASPGLPAEASRNAPWPFASSEIGPRSTVSPRVITFEAAFSRTARLNPRHSGTYSSLKPRWRGPLRDRGQRAGYNPHQSAAPRWGFPFGSLIPSSAAWGFVMAFSSDIANLGDDGFADSGGVKIHYVTKGAGPLVVLIHGIPGFWYDWRNQISALAQHF